MFTGVFAILGAYRKGVAVRPVKRVLPNVYAGWHDGTPPVKMTTFSRLLFAVRSGGLGIVIQEAVEGLREVR